MKTFFYSVGFLLPVVLANAQDCRYMEEVFSGVRVTRDITYASNASINLFSDSLHAYLDPLKLDLYEPANDTAAVRALILYFHSGNFLPYPYGESVVGTKRDSSAVEWCTKLARCGYVVASVDYRIGWNPGATTPTGRRIGIINAAYRGVQDARSCIRFFRKTALTDGNPYKIDESRIALFGDDTGGYISTHASALSDYDEILSETQLYFSDGITIRPMISLSLNGDLEGTSYGINTPAVEALGFPPGDTLCYPNHVGYSSSFNVAINLAGAVVDTTWINIGEPPILSIHTPYDFTTPYECDSIVKIRTGPVIEVSGGLCIATHMETTGIDKWINIEPLSYVNDLQRNVDQVAAARSNGLATLFPIIGDSPTDISPYEFWDRETNINDSLGILLNPNMSKEKAVLYMDSILAFILPRMYVIQNMKDLSPNKQCELSATQPVTTEVDAISVWPNITTDVMRIHSSDQNIIGINIIDAQGNLIRRYNGINSHEFELQVGDLVSGMYFLQIQGDQQWSVAWFLIP